MSSHAILATACRSCRPLAARGCKTCLPLAEKCHGYIYIPGSTARGLAALGKGSKIVDLLPQMVTTPNQPKRKEDLSRQLVRDRIANEARHIWRRWGRATLATSAAQALANVNASQREKTK